MIEKIVIDKSVIEDKIDYYKQQLEIDSLNDYVRAKLNLAEEILTNLSTPLSEELKKVASDAFDAGVQVCKDNDFIEGDYEEMTTINYFEEDIIIDKKTFLTQYFK